MNKNDLIFTENSNNFEIDMVLRFLENAKERTALEKLDIELINKYVEKMVELDGSVSLLPQYIEAFQYFYLLGYEDNVVYDKEFILKARDISEYERIYAVTGKGKYILDLFNRS